MLKNLLLLGLCLLAMPLRPLPVVAQALDPSFAPPASLYRAGRVFSMAAQQADGKRVVAGFFSRVNNTAVSSLARLDATGTLDAGFAQNVGLARNIFSVRTLPNGQYLVSGFANETITAGGLTRPALLRLNASGTADATFNAGTGPANSNSGGVQIGAFVGQPDGKVVVGGQFDSFSGQNANGLVRLTATGTLDAAFTTNLGTGFSGPVNAVVLQPDGKILAGGVFMTFNGQPTGPLVRLNADGTRDATFSGALATNAYVESLLVQPDGKVLVVGQGLTAGASIVRLTTTGSIDTGFTAPSYTANHGYSLFDTNMQLQPDGKLLFSGSFNAGRAGYITRLNTNGTADDSFSVTNGPSSYPYSIGLQSDGSLWVADYSAAFNGREAALGRLTSTGAVDATFAPKIQAPGSVEALVRQPDGQLIVGGDFTEYNGVVTHNLARLSAAGAFDAAFAAATPAVSELVKALALQADGKLLVGTTVGVRRLLTTGSPDGSYATFTASGMEGLAVQPDGKVVVIGYFINVPNTTSPQQIVRLTTGGTIDTSFRPATPDDLGQTFYLTALAVQPDGKVLVGGSFLPPTSGPVLRVLRYESTGAIDASFSRSTTFELPATTSGPIVRFNVLTVQPDGKVLVGGYFTSVSGSPRTNLARLTATGQFDSTFAPAPLTGSVLAVTLQPNGRVLVGSGDGNDGSLTTTPLLRLLDSGALDSSFGTTANPDNAVAALLVQPNGAIVVGGSFAAIGAQPAAGLARITAPNVLAVPAPTAPATCSVWPVPTHELLHVAAEANAQAAELLDALGRVVQRQALHGAETFTLATGHLPAGVYVLRVHYPSGTVARRVAVE